MYREKILQRFDEEFKQWSGNAGEPNPLLDAVQYAFKTGGKKVRPICLGLMAQLQGENDSYLPAALAVEMIHTFSLIHDDLPCMDNDDFRRGHPTVHKKFSESTALLAGDGLLAEAFGWCALNYSGDNFRSIIRELAGAAGFNGLTLGQVNDLSIGNAGSLDVLRKIHELKTAKLFEASFVIGSLISGVSEKIARRLGLGVGMIFQAVDDLLDADEKAGETSLLRFLSRDEVIARVRSETKDLENLFAQLPACPAREELMAYVGELSWRKI